MIPTSPPPPLGNSVGGPRSPTSVQQQQQLASGPGRYYSSAVPTSPSSIRRGPPAGGNGNMAGVGAAGGGVGADYGLIERRGPSQAASASTNAREVAAAQAATSIGRTAAAAARPQAPPGPEQAAGEASSSRSTLLTLALQRAQSAVLLDSANNVPAAISAYTQSVRLLKEVMERVESSLGEERRALGEVLMLNLEGERGERKRERGRKRVEAKVEEGRRLRVIHDTYEDRVRMLISMSASNAPPPPASPSASVSPPLPPAQQQPPPPALNSLRQLPPSSPPPLSSPPPRPSGPIRSASHQSLTSPTLASPLRPRPPQQQVPNGSSSSLSSTRGHATQQSVASTVSYASSGPLSPMGSTYSQQLRAQQQAQQQQHQRGQASLSSLNSSSAAHQSSEEGFSAFDPSKVGTTSAAPVVVQEPAPVVREQQEEQAREQRPGGRGLSPAPPHGSRGPSPEGGRDGPRSPTLEASALDGGRLSVSSDMTAVPSNGGRPVELLSARQEEDKPDFAGYGFPSQQQEQRREPTPVFGRGGVGGVPYVSDGAAVRPPPSSAPGSMGPPPPPMGPPPKPPGLSSMKSNESLATTASLASDEGSRPRTARSASMTTTSSGSSFLAGRTQPVFVSKPNSPALSVASGSGRFPALSDWVAREREGDGVTGLEFLIGSDPDAHLGEEEDEEDRPARSTTVSPTPSTSTSLRSAARPLSPPMPPPTSPPPPPPPHARSASVAAASTPAARMPKSSMPELMHTPSAPALGLDVNVMAPTPPSATTKYGALGGRARSQSQPGKRPAVDTRAAPELPRAVPGVRAVSGPQKPTLALAPPLEKSVSSYSSSSRTSPYPGQYGELHGDGGDTPPSASFSRPGLSPALPTGALAGFEKRYPAPMPADLGKVKLLPPIRRPYRFMKNVRASIHHGGYISPTMYVPKQVWAQAGVKLLAVEAKVRALDELIGALDGVERFGEPLLNTDVPLRPDQVDMFGERFGKELELFETVVNGVRGELVKKTGVTAKPEAKTGGSTWSRISKGLDRVTGKAMDSPVAYVECIGRLFAQVEIFDQHLLFMLEYDLAYAHMSGACRSKLEGRMRRISEFFGSVVVRFVLRDLALMMDKYAKRGSAWISAD